MTLRDQIQQYLDLKAQIDQLEAQKKEIRNQINQITGNSTIDVILDDEYKGRIQTKSRCSKKCDWTTFENRAPELYNELVTLNNISYIEVRKVRNR